MVNRSMGAIGLLGKGGSEADEGLLGINESQRKALTTSSTCDDGTIEDIADKNDFSSPGILESSLSPIEIRANEVQSLSSIDEVVSRSPMHLNQCINSEKPGYLEPVSKWKSTYNSGNTLKSPAKQSEVLR